MSEGTCMILKEKWKEWASQETDEEVCRGLGVVGVFKGGPGQRIRMTSSFFEPADSVTIAA